MNRAILPLILCVSACAPAIAIDGSEGSSEEASGSDGPGDSDEGDLDGDVDGDGDGGQNPGDEEEEEEVEPPELTLSSGDWAPTDASVVSDPCEWVDVVQDWWRTEFMELLPSEFEVDGEEGAFEIEAQSYGAQGPIRCTITEGAFSCEQQQVIPLAFDIGDYGWSYAIDFSGEVVDENTIRGTAVVSYPSVDEYTEYYLAEAGIRPSDCDQTIDLELSFER